MKRKSIYLLIALMILSIIAARPAITLANSSALFTGNVNDTRVRVGDQITYTIHGDQITDLYGYEVTVEYDASRLKYVRSETRQGGYAAPPVVSGNTVVLAYTKVGAVQGDSGKVTLGTITFSALETGDTAITLERVRFVSSESNAENVRDDSQSVTLTISRAGGNNGGGGNPGGGNPGGGNPGNNNGGNPGGGNGNSGNTGNPGTNNGNPNGENTSNIRVSVDERTRYPKAALEQGTVKITENGAAVNRYFVPASIFEQIVAMNEAGEAARGKIILEVPSDEGQGAHSVGFPASALTALIAQSPSTLISIQVSGVSYDLPLGALNLNSLSESMQADLDEMLIQVNVTWLDENEASEINRIAAQSGITLLASPIDFAVTVTANGQTVDVDFGSTYVVRTILIPGMLSDGTAAVWFDPSAGAWSYVPSVFTSVEAGTLATIKRPGNSVYALAEASVTFSDIQGHWAEQHIERMASKLLVKGVTDNQFRPQSSITRAEFAVLLQRALGLRSEEAASSLTDITTGDWYAGAVNAVFKAGIVTGFEDGTFRPHALITREQMSVMMMRAIAFANPNVVMDQTRSVLNPFHDVQQINPWALDAAATMVNAGIITGRQDQTFAPAANATRAETVVMLSRMLAVAESMN